MLKRIMKKYRKFKNKSFKRTQESHKKKDK